MCSARRNFFWLLITLSLSFSLSLQYFSVDQRKGREIGRVLDSEREREKGRGWRKCIVEMRASLSLCQVFSAELWSAWVCSPRTRVVTDRRKQDYTTLSRPINYSPLWGNKLSLSPRAIAVDVFILSDGWRVWNPTLENIGEQTETPSTNFSKSWSGGIIPHPIKTVHSKLPSSHSSKLLLRMKIHTSLVCEKFWRFFLTISTVKRSGVASPLSFSLRFWVFSFCRNISLRSLFSTWSRECAGKQKSMLI